LRTDNRLRLPKLTKIIHDIKSTITAFTVRHTGWR